MTNKQAIQELARLGAKARIVELQAEIASLQKIANADVIPFSSASNPTPKKRRMSAAARAAVSKRMKAYWAAQRKEK